MTFFWVGHFEFFFLKIFFLFCFIPMKISHKLCTRIDGIQYSWLWWFTAKNHSPQTYQPAVYSRYKIVQFIKKCLVKTLRYKIWYVPSELISPYSLCWRGRSKVHLGLNNGLMYLNTELHYSTWHIFSSLQLLPGGSGFWGWIRFKEPPEI